MATVEGGPVSSGLVNRVKSILLAPKAEWDVIATEPATVQGLFTSYAAILAVVPVIGGILGALVSGMGLLGVFGAGFLVAAIIGAVLGYVFSLVGVFVVGLIVDALAVSFGGTKDPVQAMKVAVYANTPVWIAGILKVIPAIGVIAALAGFVYCVYLLYLGLPKLMKAPEDKAIVYTAVVIIVSIVITFVIAAIVGPIVALAGFSAVATSAAVY